MKWFQHISDSLDDPFIHELMVKFGSRGYLVFFGTLEILCREDCFEGPKWFNLSYFCERLRLKRRTFLECIQFIAKRNRFIVRTRNDEISVYCPKLVDLRDYKHRKKKPKRLPSSPKVAQKYPLDIEKEKEKEIEKDIYKYRVAENVRISRKEYNSLYTKYGKSEVRMFIEKLDNYKGSTGKKYKSDYRAILSWVIKSCDLPEQPEKISYAEDAEKFKRRPRV